MMSHDLMRKWVLSNVVGLAALLVYAIAGCVFWGLGWMSFGSRMFSYVLLPAILAAPPACVVWLISGRRQLVANITFALLVLGLTALWGFGLPVIKRAEAIRAEEEARMARNRDHALNRKLWDRIEKQLLLASTKMSEPTDIRERAKSLAGAKRGCLEEIRSCAREAKGDDAKVMEALAIALDYAWTRLGAVLEAQVNSLASLEAFSGDRSKENLQSHISNLERTSDNMREYIACDDAAVVLMVDHLRKSGLDTADSQEVAEQWRVAFVPTDMRDRMRLTADMNRRVVEQLGYLLTTWGQWSFDSEKDTFVFETDEQAAEYSRRVELVRKAISDLRQSQGTGRGGVEQESGWNGGDFR